METVAKIRRLHLADRLSIRSITRKTGLSRNTIRKYLRSNEVQPRYRLNSPRPSRRLVEHEVRLQDLYAADALRSGREQMTMQGFYDILVQEGFEGSYDTVRRYILRLREKTRSGRNRVIFRWHLTEMRFSLTGVARMSFSVVLSAGFPWHISVSATAANPL